VPGGTIIFDVKCSQRLAPAIRAAGGVPLMWKTGHSLIKAKMKEIGAPLAGEMSGHIFFGERWYGFDDATYTGRAPARDPRGSRPERVLNALPTELLDARAQRACAEGEPPARGRRRLQAADGRFPFGDSRDRHRSTACAPTGPTASA
jgi:phosphomannomutase